jgi:hypothetical protein
MGNLEIRVPLLSFEVFVFQYDFKDFILFRWVLVHQDGVGVGVTKESKIFLAFDMRN